MISNINDEINDFDVERIMGDLPIEVIKENILTQIDDPYCIHQIMLMMSIRLLQMLKKN